MADEVKRRGSDTGTLVRLSPEQLQVLRAIMREPRQPAPQGNVEMGSPTAYSVDVGAPQMPPQYSVQVGEPEIAPMQVPGLDLASLYGAR